MCKIAFILILSVCIQSWAQPFASIDNYAKNLPTSEAKSVEQLAKSLTKTSKTDADKVRAFYVWIAANVAYDFAAFKSGKVPEQTANSTFASKRAVCQGYSELFNHLCQLNDIIG